MCVCTVAKSAVYDSFYGSPNTVYLGLYCTVGVLCMELCKESVM